MAETMQTEREWFNPIDYITERGYPCAHITFDPAVKHQYRIIRQVRHDGTMLFTYEMINKALWLLANQQSFYNGDVPDPSTVTSLRYIVGHARLATIFGDVDLPAGRFPGQRDRLTIPVRCEHVRKR